MTPAPTAKSMDVSIHPRVSQGRAIYAKANTAKAPKGTTKAERRLHVRQADFDRLPPSTKTGRTRPGSNKKS